MHSGVSSAGINHGEGVGWARCICHSAGAAAISRRRASAACLAPLPTLLLLGDGIASRRVL